jgi:hypothetical protein
MQTYSPQDVILSVGGYQISGYADGTFISVEREVDAYTKVVGADGEVSRTRSANRSGSLTLTLKQTSNGNAVLGSFMASDEADDSGSFDIILKDNLDNNIFSSIGWVRKVPTYEYGSEESNREWAIDLANIDYEFPEIST